MRPTQKKSSTTTQIWSKILEHFSPRCNFQSLNTILDDFDSNNKAPKILFLGDSVAFRTSRLDSDPSPLWKMISDRLIPLGKTCSVFRSGFHPQVFYYLARLFTVTANRPRVVICPINIRCFSPQWDQHPDWQFHNEIRLLKQFAATNGHSFSKKLQRIFLKLCGLACPLDGFSETRHAKLREFEKTAVNYIQSDFSRMSDFLNVVRNKPKNSAEEAYRRKILFIYHYMYELSDTHRKLLFLKRLRSLFDRLGILWLFYVTPVNYLAGQRHCGKHFSEVLCSHVNLVKVSVEETNTHSTMKRILVSQGVFHDLSCDLTPDHFFHFNDPTEHLAETGRRHVAQVVSRVCWRLLQ